MNEMRFSSGRIAAVLLLALGCAASIAANRRSPGVIENGAFKPTRPPNPNYGPDPSLACPDRGVNAFLQDALDDAAKKSGKPAAQPDGRLCAMADTLLGWEDETPPHSVLAFVSSYFGLPAPVRRIIIQNVDTLEQRDNPSAEQKDLAERLADSLVNFAAGAVQPRYGLYTQRAKRVGVAKTSQMKVVIAMLDQPLELDPFPRRMELGAQATLSGRLFGALANPKVQYTDLSGKLEAPAIPEGKSFKVDIKCGDKPGVIPIQILGGEKGAQTQLASFPLACGTALATSAPIVEPPKGPVDPAQAEAKVLELMNADRTAAGLKPLSGEKELSNIARGLSERRAKGLSISSADLAEGLKNAAISSPLVLESAAQSTSAEEAYERFTSNPTDRSYVLNKDVTHVGVGVSKGPDAGGKPTIIVTDLFVKQLPPIDVKALRAKLHEAVARKRADARAPALAKDPMLEQLAQKMAEENAAAQGSLAKARQSELEAPLYKAFRTVNLLGGVKSDPLDFAEEPGVVGPGKVIGIGLAQGTSAQFGKNSIFVVMFVGTRR